VREGPTQLPQAKAVAQSQAKEEQKDDPHDRLECRGNDQPVWRTLQKTRREAAMKPQEREDIGEGEGERSSKPRQNTVING